MIPTLILIGFVAGLLPRIGWAIAVLAVVLWPVLIPDATSSGLWFTLEVAAVAAANTAAGFVVAWSLRRVVLRFTP